MATKTMANVNNVLDPTDAPASHHMRDYEAALKGFRWKDVDRDFDWARTGKVNMAHEAIDRHLTRGRRNKVALICTDREGTAAVHLRGPVASIESLCQRRCRKLGVAKGDRVFVFLGRRPELYIAILGIMKIGAIPSPLFEAFMEDAVRDRMSNAEAVVW